jgi:DNA-binding transcriptional regulator YiaG
LRFANLMTECKLTNAALARRVDVAQSTVSHWRTGKHDVPGAVIAYLELYARAKALID